MPRKRKPIPEPIITDEALLALPAPRALPIPGTRHHHEHPRDPYEAPPGGVPRTLASESAPEIPEQKELARADQHQAARRYMMYLDALIERDGNRLQALMDVFPDLTLEEVKERTLDLHAEVTRGRPQGDLAKMLLEQDLDLYARVARIRTWVYADNASASLHALKLLGEIDEDVGEVGSFEQFLRLAKEQEVSRQRKAM